MLFLRQFIDISICSYLMNLATSGLHNMWFCYGSNFAIDSNSYYLIWLGLLCYLVILNIYPNNRFNCHNLFGPILLWNFLLHSWNSFIFCHYTENYIFLQFWSLYFLIELLWIFWFTFCMMCTWFSEWNYSFLLKKNLFIFYIWFWCLYLSLLLRLN